MSRSRRSRFSDRDPRDNPNLDWRRIDLHIHTPASIDYQEPDCSFLDILRKADSRGADLIAFTDHNTVRGYANFWREIEDLELLEALERLAPGEERRLDEYRRLMRRIRVLPGFELTTTFGFHVLAIFREGTSIRQMEHLLLALNVPEEKIDLGSGEVGATTDVLRAYEMLHDAGALVIPAHVNSTHGVAMTNFPFGGQTKIAFTQSEFIHALEATDMESTSHRSTARFFSGSKPEYSRRMHIIQGSDAHRLNRDPLRPSNLGACDRMTEVQLEEVSFDALRALFESENFGRIRPYRPSHDPYDFVRTARSEGETIVQSFHEEVPQRRGRMSTVVRDAAAFANGNGGTIFVGLSANMNEPVRGVADAGEAAREMAEDIARFITPPIAGTIDIETSGGKQVIVVQVPAGKETPYAVLPSTIFVRQEGETSIAVRDEIVQLVKRGVSSEQLPELVPARSAAPVEAEREVRVVPSTSASEVAAPESNGRQQSSRSRGGRGRRHAEPKPHVTEEHHEPAQTPETTPPTPIASASAAVDETQCADVPYPRTGVEIVSSSEIDGVQNHAMRDLRNMKVVQNVTRDSARRLWRYAIGQAEVRPAQDEDVTWYQGGDRGYWRAYKPRGGDVRYNLVYRHGDHLHVFYGVTDEGIDDDWRVVLPARLAAIGTDSDAVEHVETEPVVEAAEPAVEAPADNLGAAGETPAHRSRHRRGYAKDVEQQPASLAEQAGVEVPESAEVEVETPKPAPARRRRGYAKDVEQQPASLAEEAGVEVPETVEVEVETPKPAPARRRRGYAKDVEQQPASLAEEAGVEVPETVEVEVETPKPAPARRRRGYAKDVEQQPALLAEEARVEVPEVPETVEIEPTPDPITEPAKKPTRRRTPARAATKAEPEVVAETAAESASPSADEPAPKQPTRRRRTPAKAAEEVTEPAATSSEPEPVKKPAPRRRTPAKAATADTAPSADEPTGKPATTRRRTTTKVAASSGEPAAEPEPKPATPRRRAPAKPKAEPPAEAAETPAPPRRRRTTSSRTTPATIEDES